MPSTLSPVAVLSISANGTGRNLSELSEPVFGGYANARGEVVLFGEELAYRVNFKKQTVQQRPQLNPGASSLRRNQCRRAIRVRHEDVPTAEQRADRRDLHVGPV